MSQSSPIIHKSTAKIHKTQGNQGISEKQPATERQMIHFIFLCFLKKLWMVLLIIILISAVPAFKYFIQIRNSMPDFSQNVQGNFQQLLFYGGMFAFVYAVIEMVIHYFCDSFIEKHYLTHKKYFTAEERAKKSYTIVKFVYTFFYYSFSSYYAYSILKESDFIPGWLGGSGECRRMFEGFPRISGPLQSIKVFYWLQFGKHLARFMVHTFIKPEGKFFQYTLHHGLANFLILFSYIVNCWNVGVFILFAHDLSDAFLILPRISKEAKYNTAIISGVSVLVSLIVWVLTRLIIFPFCCISASIETVNSYIFQGPAQYFSLLIVPGGLFIFMELGLVVMHLVWTYYLIRTVIQLALGSKIVKHNYD